MKSRSQILTPSLENTSDDAARLRQRDAANPAHSVWVSASAGTGKTRVLIDRVLRLLLPRTDDTPGTRPDRILCLTYTRAAATEMTERLRARVSKWVVLNEKELSQDLFDLFGETPRSVQMKSARTLFTRLVDGPDSVRIMTIHAFCQSVLARFPLEAGISPGFNLIEGAEVGELLNAARRRVIDDSQKDTGLLSALRAVLSEINEGTLSQLLTHAFTEKRQIISSLSALRGEARRYEIFGILGLPLDFNVSALKDRIAKFFVDHNDDLRRLTNALTQDLATTAEKQLGFVLQTSIELSMPNLDQIGPAFWDKNQQPRKSGRHQGVRKKQPDIADLYESLQEQIMELSRLRARLALAQINLDFLCVIERFIAAYDDLKRARAVLDYDDIIFYTLRLLHAEKETPGASDILSWVMYKLDGGIDHVLVDEAQDTNPEQWRIIRALTASFFSDQGAGAKPNRSIFIVGDQKQSIYSFQGANPESFEQSLDHLRKFKEDHLFKRIPLNTSFRSGRAVLEVVDEVFDDDVLRQNLREQGQITHVLHRVGQGGKVELWPVIKEEKIPVPDDALPSTPAWPIGLTIIPPDDIYDRLAKRIAKRIRGWLDDKEILESHGRPIEPKDILILVRKRVPMLPCLVAALRAERIPVGGLDRFNLIDELIVCDLLALARFVLMPGDDLNLACVLKSPLMGMTDDDLIRLAPLRQGTLWQAVQQDPKSSLAARYLQDVQEKSVNVTPSSFFHFILNTPCPGDPDGSGCRALKTRVGDENADIIDDLLAMIQDLQKRGMGLLAILHHITHENPEIKRSGNSDYNMVRLMTVHGAKGLEAPIVILPDTFQSTRSAKNTPKIFWPDDTGMKLPIWSPRQTDHPEGLADVAARAEESARAEYNRLLYVALTRAQDRLIIAGAQKSETHTDPESWYMTVQKGFDRLSLMPGFDCNKTGDGDFLSFTVPQTSGPDRNQQLEKLGETEDVSLPPARSFSDQPLDLEPAPARPYRAEAVTGAKIAASPLALLADPIKFNYGLIVHKLLQVVPDLPNETRGPTIQAYLATQTEFPVETRQKIAHDVLAILNHPDFAPIFGSGSRAEVSVAGLLKDGRLMAGRIDRLCITDDTVWIVDYKTGPTPNTIPTPYLRQMAAYHDVLTRIYPHHQVRTVLIWTESEKLTEVTDMIHAAGA